MINILLILPIIFFLVLLSLAYFFLKRRNSLPKKTIISSSIPSLKEQEFNPDINTNDWDVHKPRLEKFRRSQYRGLTFFVSPENRIYYLSKEGNKVYC